MKKIAIKFIAASPLWMGAAAVFAHEGHGLSGTHWHATDTVGLLLVGGLAALAIWLSGGGRK